MLQFLRARVASLFAKILFALLIVSFAVWGIGDIFRGGGREATAISVGPIDITASELAQRFERDLSRLRQRFGGQITAEQALQLGLMNQVVQTAATDALFEAEARRLGLAAGDEAVRAAIEREPSFRDALGQFDRQLFQRALAAGGYSEGAYVELVRASLMRDQIVDAVIAGAAVPRTMAALLHRYRSERRVADVVVVPTASITDVPAPTEEELEAYYKENQAAYNAPERRAVSFVHLRPDDLVEEIHVEEERLREAYQSRIEEFTTPERRDLDQLLFADEATAREAHKRLTEGGEDFKAVADALKAEGGVVPLGEVSRRDLLVDIADTAFGAEEGKVTEPTRSALGWHVFRVNKVVPGAQRSFAEVRDQLRRDLARDRAIDALVDLGNKLEDELAGGATLEEAAERLQVRLRKVEAVDAQGRGRDGEPVADLPGGRFLETTFSTAAGELSQLVETDGGFFVARVDGVTPSAPRPLAEVRERVVTDWTADKREELAGARAEALLARIQGEETLEAVAQAAGLAVTTTPAFTRSGDGLPQGLPPSIAEVAFELEPGKTDLTEGRDGFALVRLKAVQPADPGAEDAIGRIAGQLEGEMDAVVLEGFSRALEARHGVEVNQAVIDRLFQPQQ